MAPPAAAAAAADSWASRELDQILAEGPQAAPVAGAARASGYSDPEPLPERDPVIPAGRPISYRVQPKRRVSPLLALLAIGVVALGGVGYAYYSHQDKVNDWASGLIASITANGGTAQTAPPSDGATTANGTTNGAANGGVSATGTGQPGAGSVPPSASGQTEVAAVDPGPQKFTQRLQADGSEIDAGPSPVAGADPSVSEGKSVAEKTDGAPGIAASANDAAQGTAPAGNAAAATPAQTSPAQSTPAAGQAATALPGEKMFLYEERLGQTSPTAIPGSAAWSVKEESPGGDARPDRSFRRRSPCPIAA